MTWPAKPSEEPPPPCWEGHATVARESVAEAIVEVHEAAHECPDPKKKAALERAEKALELARSEIGRALSKPKETP